MTFPGAELRIPALKIPVGVNPWPAKAAPCNPTPEAASPVALTTAPAIFSQLKGKLINQIDGRSKDHSLCDVLSLSPIRRA